MIGMKDQCFGVEVEMTGLTRRQAAQALANYFGTAPNYVGGGYDKWSVKDPAGKAWSIMSDSSIVTEMKTESGYMHTSNIEYRVEMVTPKLTYAELARQCVFDIRREKIMGAECLQQHDLILRQKRRKELFQNPNLPRHQIVVRFHPKSPRFPVMTQTPTWY